MKEYKDDPHPHYEDVCIRFFTDGIDIMSNNDDGAFPSIRLMKRVESFAREYIKTHKTEAAIAKKNEAYRLRMEDRFKNIEVARKASVAKFVYLAFDCGRGYYKIGKASNIESRLKQLRTANALIDIHSFFNGTHKDEKALHDHFAEKRVSGEWFSLDDNDLEFIRSYFYHANLPF